MELQRHWVTAGLALALAACAPAAHEQDLGFSPPGAARESTVVVQNGYWGELDIYAVTGSGRWRLGSVMTGKTAELRIPGALMGRPEIQLQADPVGPIGAFTFPSIEIRPGVTVELLVANALPMSSYSVVW